MRGKIQKKNEQYVFKANKERKSVIFNQVIEIGCICEKIDFLNKIVNLCVKKESHG
jgi:hypothetical protein